MIAPAQMAHSANASIAGVRTHRSPADLLMEDMSGTDQTTSSDDASQSASSDDGSPADHSSFASVLRKFFVPASSGAPQGQAGRVQAGQSLQQKADNVDSTLTVPVQPTSRVATCSHSRCLFRFVTLLLLPRRLSRRTSLFW